MTALNSNYPPMQDMDAIAVLISMRTSSPISSTSKVPKRRYVKKAVTGPLPSSSQTTSSQSTSTMSQCSTSSMETVIDCKEQRQKALQRYREKKLRRKENKIVIRYAVRKRLAESRPRLKGRFYKPALNTPTTTVPVAVPVATPRS